MVKNIVLKVAYDGTTYHGWQHSNSAIPTIEATLSCSLKKILKETPFLQAASRTDAGVHAKGQIINFKSNTKLPLDGIKMQLNNILPKDISIIKVYEEKDLFHPTLDCTLKEYHYFVCNSEVQMPHHRLYSWHFPYRLDFKLMEDAVHLLTGHLHFEAFCNAKKNQSYNNYMRDVTNIEIIRLEMDRICVKVKGKSFLYKMVRNLVGTILHVGCKKISLAKIKEAFLNNNRTCIGVTAKAHGLTLAEISYT